jgi:hypothetical protein
MLTDQELRIVSKPYSAGLAATQMAEHPSKQWLRRVCERISAIGSLKRSEVLSEDSSRLQGADWDSGDCDRRRK